MCERDDQGKTVTQLSDLNKHFKSHTEKHLYEYDVCDKPFISNSFLKRHLRIQNEEKRYKSGTCGISFSQVNSLRQHIKIQTGEKHYECNISGKAFSHFSNMRGSRKVCQRGSNSAIFVLFFSFFLYEKRIQIPFKVGHPRPARETLFKCRFAG